MRRERKKILVICPHPEGVAPGQAVPVVVLRDGKELTLQVKPVDGI